MSKKAITRILFAVLIISNIYLLLRVNSNTMSIISYNSEFSPKTTLSKFDNFWTESVGGSKGLLSYEDKINAEADSQTSMYVLFVLDVVLVGAIYFLNKKPKPKPAPVEDDDWRSPRRSRRRR